MGFDPITSPTADVAPNREPVFRHAEQIAAATAKLAALEKRTGKKPNVLIILMDDVGWGDFGCYGGGVVVGAPTPHIDRLARQGLLLTSCYSEPSCTPSRASLMTGRLPMRHGLLVPPMYGNAGRARRARSRSRSSSPTPATSTQAVGKWHMGENLESQPQNVGFDDFYGFLSVSDMYTEWRDPYFFPEIVYSDERTDWIKNQPFNKCFVHAQRGGEPEEVEEVTIPVLSLLDDKWADYSERFIERMAGQKKPWFLYHCTRGAHFDNYPHEQLPREVAREAPVQGHASSSSTTSSGVWSRKLEAHRPAREHARLRLVRQRTRDGDLARRRVHAVPLREGLDLGRRRARAGGRCRGRA